MESAKHKNYLGILILVLLSVPWMLLMGIAAWFTGLEGINPENRDKVPIYNVPDFIKIALQYFSVFILIPSSLVAAIFAACNMRIKKNSIHSALIAYTCFVIAWSFFMPWALTATYVEDVQRDTNFSQDVQN